jgi:Tol biopolymer transport system component
MLHSQPVDSQFLVYLPEYTHLPFFDFDDQRIIFTASEEGVPNIFAVSIQDGALRRLTETGAIFPAMLPEEGVIIYTSLAGNIEELMVMNNDGSGKRLLLTGESTALGGMTGMAKNE